MYRALTTKHFANRYYIKINKLFKISIKSYYTKKH